MNPDEWIMDPAYQLDGFESAAGFSVVAHRPKDRGKHCKGANNTCKAYKSKGTDYCAGHLRSLGLLKKDET